MTRPIYNKLTRQWVVSILATMPDGTVVKNYKSFRKKNGAYAWEREMYDKIKALKAEPCSSTILLEDAFNEWFFYSKKRHPIFQRTFDINLR